jgi:nucleotide-binding universal stress UspA family protein
MKKIRHILCPVDFSPPSAAALRYAVELAQRFDAEVTAVHAFHVPAYAMPDGSFSLPVNWTQPVIESAGRELDEFVARAPHDNVVFHTRVVEGMPHARINETAAELGADMIVMGTHGRSGLSHLLLGSVAERVVRTASVPVLTIRANSEGRAA